MPIFPIDFYILLIYICRMVDRLIGGVIIMGLLVPLGLYLWISRAGDLQ